MRKTPIVFGAVAAAGLALSACGGTSSPAATKAAISEFVASLGASPDTQVHVSASFTGAGSTKAQAVLKNVTMDLQFSSSTGSPISQSVGKVNSAFIFNVHGSKFLEIRQVDSNLYLNVDISALSSIQGVHISSAQASELNLVFGNRWFELSKGLFSSLTRSSKLSRAKVAGDQAAEAKLIDAIANLIDTTPHTSTSNGFSESGTLQSLANSLRTTFASQFHLPSHQTHPKGTYKLSITTSGSTLTGVSVSITAPNGTKGNATGSVSATITHSGTTVSAPSNATLITPALLRQFGLSSALGH